MKKKNTNNKIMISSILMMNLTLHSCGSVITLNNVQNGVPVSFPMNQAAAILLNFVIPALNPANPRFSFGSCEFTSHKTYLSHCGVRDANR